MKRIALLFAFSLAASHAEVVTWDANPPGDALGYKVYYSATAAGPFTLLGATSGLSFTNSLGGGNYYYYVTATNSCCESDPSDIAHRPGKPVNPKVSK